MKGGGKSPWTRIALLTLAALLFVHGWEVLSWLDRNAIPDGYQNEYLHVGNALDLWGAFVQRDRWHWDYYLTTNYWPPGFYLFAFPSMAALGATHKAMVLANLGHLAILLWSVFRIGERLRDPQTGLLAMVLVSLFPSVFGNMVRFEPNIAVTAWVAASLLWLLRSEGFSRPLDSFVLGLVCGLGLLMDRLSLGIFLLLPALQVLALAIWRGPRGRVLLGLVLAILGVAWMSGWWHVVFFDRHLGEVLSQGGVGEIDATGELTEAVDPNSLVGRLFYLLVLLDGQVGLVIGAAALVAIVASFPVARGDRLPILLVVAGGVGIFSLISKKQVYYTIPVLGAVAVLLADRLRAVRWAPPLVVVLVLFGVGQRSMRLWGRPLGLPAMTTTPAMPLAWVAPRHPQALEPRDLQLPIDVLAEACDQGDVVVFSDDWTWFEGFLVLQLRERLPGVRVRGIVSDPQGAYEWFSGAQHFIHVSQGEARQAWPGEAKLEAALERHHYDLGELPPAIEVVIEGEEDFEEVAWWPLSWGAGVSLFRRSG